jgi:Holliday junction resolvase
MGKMSRDKGKRGELELSRFLIQNGHPARRGQQFKGTPDSPDVICESLPIHIECKRTETLSVYKAIEQANADSDLPGVVFHRRNGRDWVVCLDG